MTKIISWANQKGGVGKSTLCIQMAYYLKEKGARVLVVDFDPQGNTSSRIAPTVTLENGERTNHYEGTRTAELFGTEPVEIHVTQCAENMDLIYTPRNDPDLAEIEQLPLEMALNPRRHLQEFAKNYDYVLMDCPPSLSRKLVGALIASTHVIVPVKLSGFSVDGLGDIITTVIGVQRSENPGLKIGGIVVNEMNRSVSHDRAISKLNEALPGMVLKNFLMQRPPIDTATTDAMPVWRLGYGHVAAKEMIKVLDEILERVG